MEEPLQYGFYFTFLSLGLGACRAGGLHDLFSHFLFKAFQKGVGGGASLLPLYLGSRRESEMFSEWKMAVDDSAANLTFLKLEEIL